jgi:hypothetical protein
MRRVASGRRFLCRPRPTRSSMRCGATFSGSSTPSRRSLRGRAPTWRGCGVRRRRRCWRPAPQMLHVRSWRCAAHAGLDTLVASGTRRCHICAGTALSGSAHAGVHTPRARQ